MQFLRYLCVHFGLLWHLLGTAVCSHLRPPKFLKAPRTISWGTSHGFWHVWGTCATPPWSSMYLWGMLRLLPQHFCNTSQALLRRPQMMSSSHLWISSRIRHYWHVQLARRHSAMIRERCIITNPYDPQHETDCSHKSFSSWNARKALPRGLGKER